MPHISYVPNGAGIRAVYDTDPTVWDPFLEFTHHLMRGPSPLTFGERELIAAFVARLCSCDYCAGAHGAAADAFGYPPELLEAMVDDVETADLSPKLRALMAYVRDLTLEPTRMTAEHARRVLEAGWNELALNHAIGIAARYVMATRISHAHGIEVSADDLARSGRTMAQEGWTCVPASRRLAGE